MICLPLFVPWPEVTFTVSSLVTKTPGVDTRYTWGVMLFRAELWSQEGEWS